MAERIQDILARQKAVQVDAGNSGAAKILRDLQQRVARAAARGAFLQEEVVSVALQETSESERLVTAESAALKRFFGKEIQVPQPPTKLFETRDVLERNRLTRFEAHYLPEEELTVKDKLPGWQVKPEKWYWDQIKSGSVARDAATLKAGWYLVDGRGKPQYNDGQQRYDDDAWLQATIHDLRGSGKVKSLNYVASDSRFGVSADEVEGVILPEVAKLLPAGVSIRMPREIEFNVLGNIHHPEWGNTNTWEWMNDHFERGRRLFGGDSGVGGLASVYCDSSDYRNGSIAVRSLVEIPSK